MTTVEMINVMQSYENGAELEYCMHPSNTWLNTKNPAWNWVSYGYRVKQPTKQKLWYWEFKYEGGNEQWWKIYADRMTLDEAEGAFRNMKQYRKLEALGFIEE